MSSVMEERHGNSKLHYYSGEEGRENVGSVLPYLDDSALDVGGECEMNLERELTGRP